MNARRGCRRPFTLIAAVAFTLACLLLAAILTVWAGANSAAAAPANHLTGNRVTFAAGGSCPVGAFCYIYLDRSAPYNSPERTIRPGESSYPWASNVDCFLPAQTLYSYWNSPYYANAVRCFSSSGNRLTLYAYRH